MLHENIKMKEYIKPKGRPKQSSKLWPSKNKKRLREKENLPCNAQPLIPKPKRWKTCQPGTAANRMRIKRELKQKESSKSGKSLSNDCIALSSDEDEVDSKAVVANVKVLPVDFKTLKSSTGWMNDRLINAGLSLLKQKFPNTIGLKNVISVQTCGFSEEYGENEFVQIINCFDNHWICFTNKNSKQIEIKVHDSMRTGDVCINGKEIITLLVRTPRKYLSLTFSDVQQQQGGSDCGLHALAFSFSLCTVTDPAKLV